MQLSDKSEGFRDPGLREQDEEVVALLGLHGAKPGSRQLVEDSEGWTRLPANSIIFWF